MSGIILVDIGVNDPVRYEDYKKMAGPTVQQYGGEYLVRGGRAETLEGGWEARRFVVLRFESYERALEWWNSPEYAAAKALRQEISDSRMVVVEGA